MDKVTPEQFESRYPMDMLRHAAAVFYGTAHGNRSDTALRTPDGLAKCWTWWVEQNDGDEIAACEAALDYSCSSPWTPPPPCY